MPIAIAHGGKHIDVAALRGAKQIAMQLAAENVVGLQFGGDCPPPTDFAGIRTVHDPILAESHRLSDVSVVKELWHPSEFARGDVKHVREQQGWQDR